ncbi:hypothetical protein FS749_016798 [Ceratobasidium sp. UAMH 11750]|nr:hypothetical protein FS749_016798 [Ceratobasidium sp. UAMH 11750]
MQVPSGGGSRSGSRAPPDATNVSDYLTIAAQVVSQLQPSGTSAAQASSSSVIPPSLAAAVTHPQHIIQKKGTSKCTHGDNTIDDQDNKRSKSGS